MTQETVIGIDLGGTNCRGALVSVGGELISSCRISTRTDVGLVSFLEHLLKFCRTLSGKAEHQGLKVTAVGLGVPGIIAPGGVVQVSPNLSFLNQIPLAARLQDRLGLPVTVVNDANAIAWGEALFGAGRNFRSFLTLTLGTGVGGGLVLDRRLWAGADGAAGEVGHIMVEPEGRPCGCGSRGCLEQYSSATGIVKTARAALETGEKSLLADLPGTMLTCDRVAEAARGGDRVALAALAEAGRRLGQVLAGVANLLNLDAAVVAGGAGESLELMRPELEREFRARAFNTPADRLCIIRGELGDEAGILGAAGLALATESKA